MASHRITLKYNLILQTNGKWRLQVWTAATENMTDKIFVYQRKSGVPYMEDPRDVFVNIAQPCDLVEYPEDSPNDTFPFFRQQFADVEINNARLVYDTMSGISTDARELCQGLDRIDQ